MAAVSLSPSAVRQRIFCLAAPGLERCLQRELQGLRVPGRMEEVPGGIIVDGVAESMWKTVLQSRIAESVRFRVGDPFHAPDKRTLERRLQNLPWGDVFDRTRIHAIMNQNEDPFADQSARPLVKVSSNKSRLYHTGLVEECVTNALQAWSNAQPGKDTSNAANACIDTQAGRKKVATPVVNATIRYDECQISVGASGDMYQRGYRKAVGEAPLRETLAAACVMEAAPLRRLSIAAHSNEELVLWDPFCGSGVLLLEALGIAMGQPPGHPLKRHPFTSFACHDADSYSKVVSGMDSHGHQALERLTLLGTDHDPKQIESSERNLRRFQRRLWRGHGHPDQTSESPFEESALPCKINFSIGSVAQACRSLEGRPTMILTNVPYGVLTGGRPGKSGSGWTEAVEAYTQLGRMLRRNDVDWRGVFCLVENAEKFREHTGLEWVSKLRFVSGGSRWVDLLEWTGKRNMQHRSAKFRARNSNGLR